MKTFNRGEIFGKGVLLYTQENWQFALAKER
jgi:hypothetical protein